MAMESVEQSAESRGRAQEVAYPPAPWELYGQAQLHLLVVAARLLPALPTGFRPLTIAGHVPVIAGWIRYEGGSVLRYGELLAAPVGIVDRRLTATVTHMWVDSEASRRGGRELWGYPKELADFQLEIAPDGTARTNDAGGPIAAGHFRQLVSSPVRLSGRGGTMQPQGGRLRHVPAIFRGTPALGSGSFEAAPGGPLAHLASARRLLSFGLRDFHFTFGLER